MVLGPNILAVDGMLYLMNQGYLINSLISTGEEHAGHRRILVPGFTQAAAKNFILALCTCLRG